MLLKNIIQLNTSYIVFTSKEIFYVNKKVNDYEILIFNNNGDKMFAQDYVHNNGLIYNLQNHIFLFNLFDDCLQFDLVDYSLKKIINANGFKFTRSYLDFLVYSDKYSFEKTNQLETPAIKYIYKLDELIWTYEKFGTIEIFSDDYALCFTDSNPIID